MFHVLCEGEELNGPDTGSKLQARSAGSGWEASPVVSSRWDWHRHQWGYEGKKRIF